MPHFVDELKGLADAAIGAMREAALAARHLHARAELMRHMLTTARKVQGEPKPQAIEKVVAEWMQAWNLRRAEWPRLAREIEAFTAAFYDYARHPTDAADAALRAGCAALDSALAEQGTSLADEMARRSQCAHGWWEMVSPTPPDLPGRKERPSMPIYTPGTAFWDAGCPDFCK